MDSVTDVDLVVRTLANVEELKVEEPIKIAEEEVSAGQVLAFEDVSPPAPVEPPVAEATNVQATESRPAEGPPAVVASSELQAAPKPVATEQDPPNPGGRAPEIVGVAQPVIRFQFDPNAALKKAILNPDIYTDKADRSRAIDLRWVLRDIRAKRTTWWPVGDLDLRVLIDMGLVELREDVPVLTIVGLDAIA